MERKGQAAMEFLMTYGWAILAAIIAIGVLAYFGVFSPSKFVSDTYTLNAPFNLRAVAASVATGVQLDVLNGAGETVTITAITVSGCAGAVTPGLPYLQPTGNYTVYTVPCVPALTAGNIFRGDVTVTYTKGDSALPQRATGSIVTRVP